MNICKLKTVVYICRLGFMYIKDQDFLSTADLVRTVGCVQNAYLSSKLLYVVENIDILIKF